MIPWDTFETPLDAYEWAKANITAPCIERLTTGYLLFGSIEPYGMQLIGTLPVLR